MTNPLIGFINTIGLFLSGRVVFDKDAIGKTIYYKKKDLKSLEELALGIEKTLKPTSLSGSNLKI